MSALSFRKQFQRVRQNIDQNLGRAEKTEVLTEEDLNVERKVELLKNVCSNVSKKLLPCVRSVGGNPDPEKRVKKIPEYGLYQALIECSVQLEQNTPTGRVFNLTGDAVYNVVQEMNQLDLELENKIVKTLQTIVEVDYPTVQKLRKQLNSKTLDMDAAKSRYQSIQKQYQSGAVTQAKVEEVRNEMEDAMGRVEQAKDQLAIDMYNFAAKEMDVNQNLLELVQAQAVFHKKCLQNLEDFIPKIQQQINLSCQKPVFGQRLEEHLEGRSRDIALVIEECIQYLNQHGIEEEGLFRIAGSSSKVKKLKSAFNSNAAIGPVVNINEEYEYDVHAVASLLKTYLRELPEPLMKSNLFKDWISALEKPADQVAPHLKEVANKLPRLYYKNLRYLIKFLSKLSASSDINKMTPGNIGLVMGPNLLWPPGDEGSNMMTTGYQNALVEALVSNVDVVFPEASEIDLSDTTFSPSANVHVTLHLNDLNNKSFNAHAGLQETRASTAEHLILPQQPGMTISTLRKGKKQQAPQPPAQDGIVIPQFFPPAQPSQDYPPSPKIEKPRVPPPERPTIPPPDKPAVMERPKGMPPAIPNFHANRSSSPYAAFPALSVPQQPVSLVSQSSNNGTISQPPSSSTCEMTSFQNFNQMSSSMSSISLPSGERVVSSITTSPQSLDATNPFYEPPPGSRQSNSFKLYPSLDTSEPVGSSADNSLASKGHSRQPSTGSKPIPPRPHPPVPPKKVELKSSDF